MEKSSTIFYYGQTEAYEKLLLFCALKGFKVKDNIKKFYFIGAKRNYLLFWRNKQVELEIHPIGKEQVEVFAKIYQRGSRQPAQEDKFIISMQKFF